MVSGIFTECPYKNVFNYKWKLASCRYYRYYFLVSTQRSNIIISYMYSHEDLLTRLKTK